MRSQRGAASRRQPGCGERASEHQGGTLGTGVPRASLRSAGHCRADWREVRYRGELSLCDLAEDREGPRAEQWAVGGQDFLSPEVLGMDKRQSLGREW